jgi:hypothetical protein
MSLGSSSPRQIWEEVEGACDAVPGFDSVDPTGAVVLHLCIDGGGPGEPSVLRKWELASATESRAAHGRRRVIDTPIGEYEATISIVMCMFDSEKFIAVQKARTAVELHLSATS